MNTITIKKSVLEDFAVLIDFGSTYTKVALVDLTSEELIARHQSVTTVNQNIMIGLKNAISLFSPTEQQLLESGKKSACSSAAGGLRVIAVGLVPALTVEAARRAALGAGAKIVDSFGYELTDAELEIINSEPCDLILLSGGVDGGNKDILLYNAKMLSRIEKDIPFIVAGNKVVNQKAAEILKAAGHFAVTTENILPELDELNVEPARQVIREIFMSRIVKAKGLDGAQQYIGGIIMPTPMATLEAGRLLAEGTKNEAGIGELMIVEVGGATTNVHSVASGQTNKSSYFSRGLPEPFAKRTVEGDLGIRYNAMTILEKIGAEIVLKNIPDKNLDLDMPALLKRVNYLSQNVGALPENAADCLIDAALARCAVSVAVERHTGVVKEVPTLQGPTQILYGKDLTSIPTLIGAGGIFAYGRYPKPILQSALFDSHNPASLKPLNPKIYIDKHYLLYGIGLLKSSYPDQALRIAKKYLQAV